MAEVLISKEEALKTLLPQVQTIEKKSIILSDEQKKKIEQQANISFKNGYGDEFLFFIGKANGEVVGYVAEDTVHGKWGPIHYLLGIDPSGKVRDVVVLEYKEKRGKPVAKNNFLRQYIGKTIHDSVRLHKDINGITGATISSRGMTDGIRKLLYVFEEFRRM